jgi:hypothetical protein
VEHVTCIFTVEEEARLETSKNQIVGFLLGLLFDSENGGNMFL